MSLDIRTYYRTHIFKKPTSESGSRLFAQMPSLFG